MATNFKIKLKRKIKGQTLVEFALVMPILLMVVYGLMETGRLIFTYATVISAAREGARFGSATGIVGVTYQYKNCAGIRAAAKKVDALGVISDTHITIQYDRNGDGNFSRSCAPGVALSSGDRIRVTVQAEFVPFIGMLPLVTRSFGGTSPDPLSSSDIRTVLGEVEVAGAMVGLPIDLTVHINGTGTVTSTDGQIDCPDVSCEGSYTSGSAVGLTASTTPYMFLSWGGAAATCGSDPTCVFVLGGDDDVYANFGGPQTLTVTKISVGGGTGNVISNDGYIDCGATCRYDNYENVTVHLQAIEDGSSRFLGWGGDCSGRGACSVNMNQGHNVTATFGPNGYLVLLTVTSPMGSGGTVTSYTGGNPDGILDCTASCAASFPIGELVTLQAEPFAGSIFKGWTSTECSGSNPVCGFWIHGDTPITATFDTIEKVLEVKKIGTGATSGLVTSTPAGIDCGNFCSSSFPTGDTVTLQVPLPLPAGITFTGWSGGGCTGTGDCVVTMDTYQLVSASFEDYNDRTLEVINIGTGGGTVRSNSGSPNPIVCPSICSATFTYNSPPIMVTLTAEPDTNSTFGGWSGNCAPVTGTPTACTVAMNVSQTVTAQFDPIILPPCTFESERITWENSAKTITWVFFNTAPAPSSIETKSLWVQFGGTNLLQVVLDGRVVPIQEIEPTGTLIPMPGRFLLTGNHVIIFTFATPTNLQGKNFVAMVHMMPDPCAEPSVEWIVK